METGLTSDGVTTEADAKPAFRWATPTALVGLVLLGIVAYSNSFAGRFVFDDLPTIEQNEALKSPATTLFGEAREIPGGLRRRTIPHFTFALNHAVGGLDVWGFHFVNLLIHVVAAMLLFDNVRMTLELPSIPESLRRERTLVAFVAAAVWLVHPLQTESVTYIVQRVESLMGMFFLLTFNCVIRGARSKSTVSMTIWNGCAVVACWLGMFSKEVMIAAPPLILLYDRLLLTDGWRASLRKRGWMYAGFAIPSLMLVWIVYDPPKNVPGGSRMMMNILETPTNWEYFWTQPSVVLHYLRLAVWPDSLCFIYAWPVERNLWWIVLPTVFHAGLLAVAVLSIRKRPGLSFLIVAFYLVLAPTSSIKAIPNIAFEHRMYVPLACVSVLLVSCLWLFLARATLGESRARVVFASLAAVAICVLTFGTRARNTVYHDKVVFWEDSIEKGFPNAAVHNNLGAALQNSGRVEESLEHYERALEIEPSAYMALRNVGATLIQLERFRESEPFELRAIELQPKDATARYNHAIGLQARGRLEESLAEFRTSIELEPSFRAHHNAGIVCQQLGRVDEAIYHYTKAVAAEPGKVNSRLGLAHLLFVRGHIDLGRRQIDAALRLDPSVRPQVEQILRIHAHRLTGST